MQNFYKYLKHILCDVFKNIFNGMPYTTLTSIDGFLTNIVNVDKVAITFNSFAIIFCKIPSLRNSSKNWNAFSLWVMWDVKRVFYACLISFWSLCHLICLGL